MYRQNSYFINIDTVWTIVMMSVYLGFHQRQLNVNAGLTDIKI